MHVLGLIADDGDSDGAIHILSQLLEKAPDAFVFRFRFSSCPSVSDTSGSLTCNVNPLSERSFESSDKILKVPKQVNSAHSTPGASISCDSWDVDRKQILSNACCLTQGTKKRAVAWISFGSILRHQAMWDKRPWRVCRLGITYHRMALRL